MTLDLGSGAIWPRSATARCRPAPCARHVLDAREEFARDFVLPSLKADALSDGALSDGDRARRVR